MTGLSPGGASLGAAQLLGPTEIRELAARLGIQPAKRLGQNFVVDAGTVSRITALAGSARRTSCWRSGPASAR